VVFLGQHWRQLYGLAEEPGVERGMANLALLAHQQAGYTTGRAGSGPVANYLLVTDWASLCVLGDLVQRREGAMSRSNFRASG
jgi:hypothetical protein